MKRTTISDVAKLAGVSASTISNYLNGRYDYMSFETRKRVEEAVAALRYTPNISARRLSAKEKCGVICLIIPVNIAHFFGSFYYPAVLSSVGNASAQLDYNILIYIRGGKDPAKEIEYLKGMYGTIAEGFMLFDLTRDDFYFREFDQARIPYVCVGKFPGFDDYHFVASDHAQAVSEAVDHLAELGHRKIALVYDTGDSIVPKIRYDGFCEAMGRHNIAVEQRYLARPAPYAGPGENRRFLQELLLQPDPPTAIIASIESAPEIEQFCTDRGWEIPGDLSVVLLDYLEGYNLRLSSYTHSKNIASVIAERAFHHLLNYIQQPGESFCSELLPLPLQVGASTAPPRENNHFK